MALLSTEAKYMAISDCSCRANVTFSSDNLSHREQTEPCCSSTVSALNFVLISFPHILSCIANSRNPSQPSRNACPTLHPPLRFIPHDPHDLNNSYDLCLKTSQSLGVYRDILECYPDHPDPSQPRGLLLHPASHIPIPGCLQNRYDSPTPTAGAPPYHNALLSL